jgi:hypothetical protein
MLWAPLHPVPILYPLLACQRSSGRWAGHASRRSKDALAILGGMLNLTPQEREAIGVDDEIPADPVLQVRQGGGGG